jgi:hypothetical protein
MKERKNASESKRVIEMLTEYEKLASGPVSGAAATISSENEKKARYFKSGPGEYAQGELFNGLTVPQTRQK